MTDMSPTIPSGHPSSEFELPENALLTLWRTFWLVLPLAWACEVDRLLHGWIQPIDIRAGTSARAKVTDRVHQQSWFA